MFRKKLLLERTEENRLFRQKFYEALLILARVWPQDSGKCPIMLDIPSVEDRIEFTSGYHYDLKSIYAYVTGLYVKYTPSQGNESPKLCEPTATPCVPEDVDRIYFKAEEKNLNPSVSKPFFSSRALFYAGEAAFFALNAALFLWSATVVALAYLAPALLFTTIVACFAIAPFLASGMVFLAGAFYGKYKDDREEKQSRGNPQAQSQKDFHSELDDRLKNFEYKANAPSCEVAVQPVSPVDAVQDDKRVEVLVQPPQARSSSAVVLSATGDLTPRSLSTEPRGGKGEVSDRKGIGLSSNAAKDEKREKHSNAVLTRIAKEKEKAANDASVFLISNWELVDSRLQVTQASAAAVSSPAVARSN